MRQYGIVPSKFWIEAKEKGLSDDGKQLMAYLMSCHHGNSIGCFRMPVAYIADDLGWGFERVSQTLSETVSKGFLERDEERSWNRLPNHFETVSISNPNVAKGMEPFIESVPKESPLFNSLLKSLRPHEKRFRNGYLNGLINPYLNGFETKAAASSSSKEELLINTSELEAARGQTVDNFKTELDLSDINVASVVIAKMIGRKKLTVEDQIVLKGWCKNYDIEHVVLPWLEIRLQNSQNLHSLAHPLKYFHSGLNEHVERLGIKN